MKSICRSNLLVISFLCIIALNTLTASNSTTEQNKTIWSFDRKKNGEFYDKSQKIICKTFHTLFRNSPKGKALYFKGSKSYATIPWEKVFSYSNYLELAFWFYPQSENGTLISKYEEATNKRSFNLALEKGKLSFTITGNGQGGGWTKLEIAKKISLNKWYHIKAVYDSGTIKIYIDNKLAGTNNKAPYKILCPPAPIQVGRYYWGNGSKNYFKGYIDELSITTLKPRVKGILDHPAKWEIVSGSWNFKDGIVTQSSTQKEKTFLLKLKQELPKKPFQIKFEMRTYETKSDPFIPEAYLVVKSDVKSSCGHGFGLNRSGGNQIWWKLFPSDSKIDFARDKSGKNWGGPWHKFTLNVYGPCFELFYPENVMNPNLQADKLIIRGYYWKYLKQRHLVLRTNGAKAAFRNISIKPLSKVKPEKQFKMIAPENAAIVTSNRPTLKWQPIAENKREDFEYHIKILKNNQTIISDRTNSKYYRPDKALSPGKYTWIVEAKTFYGKVWGGEIKGQFSISHKTAKEHNKITINGPFPKHFTSYTPELSWKWNSSNAFDQIEISVNNNFAGRHNAKNKTKINLQLSKGIKDGLNLITLKFYKNNRLIETINTFGIRTNIPPVHSIRKDGVLLRNDKVFVPVVAYRDPSDTLTRTDGLQEAGFNVTHSYHFDGAHYYDIKKEDLNKEFSDEKLNQLIADAKAYLRLCNKNGIKVALSIRRSWIYYQKTDLIRKYVASLMGEPGLLTWYLYDEPDYIGIPAEIIRNSYKIIKQTDPYHPVSMIYAHANLIPRFIRSCDILWCQAYHEKPADVLEHINTLFYIRKKSAGFGISHNNPNPLASWAILGAFDQEVRYKRRKASEHRPTPEQILAQSYACLIGKARGITFYWFPHNWYDIRKETPQIWQAIIRSVNQINKILPYLLERGKELDIPKANNYIKVRAKRLDSGKTIVVLLNPQTDKKAASLSWQWHFSGIKKHKKIAGSGKYGLKNGKLNVELLPFEGIAILLSE